jgi:F0F1-type ATP synthase membrane subunit b/b'
MGFLRKLLGFGTTVAGTVAAVKVSEKVKENNPEGVQDVNGDGKVDYKDYAIEAKKAAKEVYAEVREKAPGVMAEAKERGSELYQDAKEKVKETFGGQK